MAQKSYLETRVLAMLDPSLSRGRVTRGLFAMATLAVAFSIVPLAVLRAPAQTTGGGKVSGTVYDASGAAVAKAQVTLKNTTGRNTELTRTNESGAYEISGMPLGTYTLQVAAKGFERYVQPGVVVTAGSASAQNISLQIGKINETVNVTAEGAKSADDRTPPSRIKMGGSVQATKLVHMVRPEYPAVAKAQGIEGSVLLRAVIGKEGQILNLELLNTAVDQSLADAAMESVRQWRYEPTLLNGEPVEVITEITVNFTLAR